MSLVKDLPHVRRNHRITTSLIYLKLGKIQTAPASYLAVTKADITRRPAGGHPFDISFLAWIMGLHCRLCLV